MSDDDFRTPLQRAIGPAVGAAAPWLLGLFLLVVSAVAIVGRWYVVGWLMGWR